MLWREGGVGLASGSRLGLPNLGSGSCKRMNHVRSCVFLDGWIFYRTEMTFIFLSVYSTSEPHWFLASPLRHDGHSLVQPPHPASAPFHQPRYRALHPLLSLLVISEPLADHLRPGSDSHRLQPRALLYRSVHFDAGAGVQGCLCEGHEIYVCRDVDETWRGERGGRGVGSYAADGGGWDCRSGAIVQNQRCACGFGFGFDLGLIPCGGGCRGSGPANASGEICSVGVGFRGDFDD